MKKIKKNSCDYNVNQCRYNCVIRICVKSVEFFFYEIKLIVIPESNRLNSATNVTELDKPKEGP